MRQLPGIIAAALALSAGPSGYDRYVAVESIRYRGRGAYFGRGKGHGSKNARHYELALVKRRSRNRAARAARKVSRKFRKH